MVAIKRFLEQIVCSHDHGQLYSDKGEAESDYGYECTRCKHCKAIMTTDNPGHK